MHYAHEHQIYLGKFSLKNTSIAENSTLQALGDRLGLVPATDFQLYMGHRGHRSGLHYDVMDGTVVQLYGEKQVNLFPPSQTENLYPYSVFVHLCHGSRLRCWHSQVAPEALDLQAFPKVKQALASQQEVLLKQGEILYIPAGWWHDVTTLGDEMACSVSRFWRIYPTSRAVFCWNRWRSVVGNLLRVPHLLTELAAIPFQQDSKQKFHEFLHRI